MNVNELKGKVIAFAASGGLDSCTITRWLTDEGVRVVSMTADLGQPDETNIDDIRTRMLACGAEDAVILDVRKEIAEAGLKVIQARALYEDGYWNTTGIARHVTTKIILAEMKKRGISILAHGATGRGNDQVRFQIVTNLLEPSFSVYAPWRDFEFLKGFKGRSEMIDFCNDKGLPIKASKSKPYSTDANLLGLTHEAGKLESLMTPADFVKPEMGRLPKDAPETPETFKVRWEKGVPVEVNGNSVTVLEAFEIANATGGKNGIGINLHLVENRFVGIKSRGIYETPGMDLLGQCYLYLLQITLDRRAREIYDALSLYIGKQIYQGYAFDLGSQMAWSAIAKSSELISGTVTVSLYKGKISFVSIDDAKNCIYSEEDASMEAVGTYDHSDTEGLLRVFGVSAKAVARGGQIKGII